MTFSFTLNLLCDPWGLFDLSVFVPWASSPYKGCQLDTRREWGLHVDLGTSKRNLTFSLGTVAHSQGQAEVQAAGDPRCPGRQVCAANVQSPSATSHLRGCFLG